MIYNIKLIDFNDFFNKSISIDILNTIHAYNLFVNKKLNLKNKETKQVISHFIAYHVAKMLNNFDINKNIIVIQPNIINDVSEIIEYSDSDSIKRLIKSVLSELKKIYPNKIFVSRKVVDFENPDTIRLFFNKYNDRFF